MTAISAAREVIERSGFHTETTNNGHVLRIKSKDGKTVIGSVFVDPKFSEQKAVAEAKEALDAAAREPGARK